MTKFRRKRMERQQLVRDVSIAVAPVFLDLILKEAFKARASEKDARELRQTAAECAWAHGEIFARVAP